MTIKVTQLASVFDRINAGDVSLPCHIDCKDDWQRDMYLNILQKIDTVRDISVQYEGNARIYFTSTNGHIPGAVASAVVLDV